MKKQQQWVKDILFIIIKLMKRNHYNGDFAKVGYTYTINAALDNYPQVYWDKKNNMNIGMFHKYHKFGEGIYRNVLMSKEAYDYMSAFASKSFIENTDEKNNLKKKLHGEHLTPQSYSRHKLNEIVTSKKKISDKELKEKIQYALSDSKICIITKEECKILDGKGKRFSKDEIRDFLDEYELYRNPIPENMKSDFDNLDGKLKKTFGFGSIRLYVLLKNGVKFVNDKGEEKSFKECIEYLEDGDYTI